MITLARTLYAENGIRALFRGAVPRAVRVAPAAAIMISSYEQFKKILTARKLSLLEES